MIVDPDFLDHWRTRMVVDALGGDEMASIYILRLWAHCQVRKSDRFEIPTAGLKAQCRYQGDAQQFEQALTDAGFIERDGKEIIVVGWADQNAALIAAWENGAKGGRPKKPIQNPEETHGKPSGNPDLTQTKPIREDEIREESTNPNGLVVASDAADHCPHQQIIALYHEVLPMCPRVRDWTPARATQLRARWNESKERQNIDYWKRFFEYVRGCDFLVGKTHKPFFADLEWLIRSANFTKIREGKYENRGKE